MYKGKKESEKGDKLFQHAGCQRNDHCPMDIQMSSRVKEVQEDPHGSDCEYRLLVQLILWASEGM